MMGLPSLIPLLFKYFLHVHHVSHLHKEKERRSITKAISAADNDETKELGLGWDCLVHGLVA